MPIHAEMQTSGKSARQDLKDETGGIVQTESALVYRDELSTGVFLWRLRARHLRSCRSASRGYLEIYQTKHTTVVITPFRRLGKGLADHIGPLLR